MGEVYKARDTRLERTVAIKVLSQRLSASPEVRQRFEREARTISQLSHPHICALYDVGSHEGTEYLVMEYLEGETLSERLAKGALPLEQMLKFSIEIADALDKAHRQGIVHRDLKPGNVMLTKSGVKLLDFGLAKAVAPAPQRGSLTSLPTQQGLTHEGTILGTFQYMAPEQLEGKDADVRSDIFALGALLYEMATGKKAFSGSSQASLITAIMSSEPPAISTVQPMTPSALDRVVKTCLSKDPEDRWQSASDLRNELKWIADGSSQTRIAVPIAARRMGRAWLPAAAAIAIAFAALGFAAARLIHPPPPGIPVLRASIVLPPRMELDPQNTAIALAPDGSRLVLAAIGADGKRRLWLRALDGLDPQPLSGTDNATCPFWSPDSRMIGFFADKKLKKVPASGGTVQTICDAADGRGGSWGSRDVIVFAPAPFSGLARVSAAGGTPTALTEVREQGATHRLPFFLPDGRHVLFLSGTAKSIDKGNAICALDLDTGQITVVTHENSEGRYAEPGYLLFFREGNLMAQPMDAKRLRVTGEAIPIAEGVQFNLLRWSIGVSFSRTGLVVLQAGSAGSKSRLTWFDLDGKELGVIGEPAPIRMHAISPDGSRVAAVIPAADGTSAGIWIYDLARGVPTRLSYEGGFQIAPLWSPDGKRVAYGDSEAGSLLVRAADGTSEPKSLYRAPTNVWPLSWSPDGRLIAFRLQDPKTGRLDLWIVPADGSEPAKPYIATPGQETWGAFSPDGKWFGYVSDESGRNELYIVPFPGPGLKRQISSGGADLGIWLAAGRRIAYRQPPGNKLFAVELEPRGSTLAIGATTPIFGGKPFPDTLFSDVTHDGKRLLIAVPVEDSQAGGLTLVTNWTAELIRKR